MTFEEIKQLTEFDRSLKQGNLVTVRWGYGSGFRAEGRGVVSAVFPKSVRVVLIESVWYNNEKQASGKEADWPAGFELHGIPRFSLLSRNWDYWHSVSPCNHLGGKP